MNKCALPGCELEARTSRTLSTCCRDHDQKLWRIRHPKIPVSVTKICALPGCEKTARSNRKNSYCCTAHKLLHFMTLRYPAGRMVKRLCACGCGQEFEADTHDPKQKSTAYVNEEHHQNALKRRYEQSHPVKPQVVHHVCGCSKHCGLEFDGHPKAVYAPDCPTRREKEMARMRRAYETRKGGPVVQKKAKPKTEKSTTNLLKAAAPFNAPRYEYVQRARIAQLPKGKDERRLCDAIERVVREAYQRGDAFEKQIIEYNNPDIKF